MRRWASVLIRGVVQETPAPRRPACPARESGTAVPDKRTKAVPGDEPRDHPPPPPRSITFMKPSRIYTWTRRRSTLDCQASSDHSEYFHFPSFVLLRVCSVFLSLALNFEPTFLRYFSHYGRKKKDRISFSSFKIERENVVLNNICIY